MLKLIANYYYCSDIVITTLADLHQSKFPHSYMVSRHKWLGHTMERVDSWKSANSQSHKYQLNRSLDADKLESVN